MTQDLQHDDDGGGGGDPLGGKLLTPRQVGDRLQVDNETLRRWARQGKGPPFVKIAPATRRYPENGLMAWMRDHMQPQQQEERAS